jgi:hypothetical protein
MDISHSKWFLGLSSHHEKGRGFGLKPSRSNGSWQAGILEEPGLKPSEETSQLPKKPKRERAAPVPCTSGTASN